MLRNTCANGIQLRNAMIFHSVDILNENTDSQAAMAQSVEQATGARKVQDSNLAHSAL